MADATILAAWITGLLSLTGTGVTATVQLVDGGRSNTVVSNPARAAGDEDGICLRAVDRLLDFATDHPDAAQLYAEDTDALPRLYSAAEIAECGHDAARVGKLFEQMNR